MRSNNYNNEIVLKLHKSKLFIAIYILKVYKIYFKINVLYLLNNEVFYLYNI
jgi:ABC-type arginine/histidine transport system permease subunit